MTHASLFSGIGGPEVAAKMLGWDNLFYCEINPFCRRVLEYHFPESVSYEDITKTDFTQLRGRVDVLTGGFPCQPFSYAGKRGGAEDDRYLWPEMLRAISECQPTWVVGENVAGLATMVEQCEITELGAQPTLFEAVEAVPESLYEERGRYTIDRICQDLEAIGYAVQPVLIPACGVGAPHRRDRIFIIGHRNTPDTGGIGGREIHEHLEPELTERHEPVCDGRERNVTDTDEQKLEERLSARQSANSTQARTRMDYRTKRPCDDGTAAYTKSEQCTGFRNEQSQFSTKREVQFRGIGCKDYDCGARWQGFPSVSAVHRGNDGLPFSLDDLTIPFTQWRTESLKAYGNAIVPQVMYEIFRAIETITKNNR